MLPHHPKIPTSIENYEITFKWPFEVEIRATIKRIK